jgi:hypothetical protein
MLRAAIRRFHLSTATATRPKIFEFAARGAPGHLDADLPPRYGGPAPAHRSGRPAAAFEETTMTVVAELLGSVAGTVGVIVPAARLADVRDWLDDPRVQVVDGMRAKGME